MGRTFIRLETTPAQAILDVIFGTFHEPSLVGILHAQHQLPAMPTREEIVVKHGAHATDVQPTGGGGGKTDTDSLGSVRHAKGIFLKRRQKSFKQKQAAQGSLFLEKEE
jgi:hypothetical protein